MRAVAEKPHDAIVKFDTYQNIQRHRVVLTAIAWHLVLADPIVQQLQLHKSPTVITDMYQIVKSSNILCLILQTIS